MKKSKHIVFTGGGSAGHVTPNVALIPTFQKKGWKVSYIGSPHGLEKSIIEPLGVSYYTVYSGKFRRYFSLKNIADLFWIFYGILQAFFLIKRLKPSIVFSKGGYVAFPVVTASWLNRVPVISHESDLSPGLANRLAFPFLTRLCVTFPETQRYFKKSNKIMITGTPIREALFQGKSDKGKALCGFPDNHKPILLVLGGGLGSVVLNETIYTALSHLLIFYNIIHVCGKGKKSDVRIETPGYIQFEFLYDTLPDILAYSDVILSRAGLNTIYELVSLRKTHLLVPLPSSSSRGDQILNAHFFLKKRCSRVIDERNLNTENLLYELNALYKERDRYIEEMKKWDFQKAAESIVKIIEEHII